MNVVRTPVSSNSEPLNLASRQDRNASGKGENSGFAQTLEVVDKAGATKQSGSSAPADPASSQAATTEDAAVNERVTGGAVVDQQNGADQQQALTISDLIPPALSDLNGIANAALDNGVKVPGEDTEVAAQATDLEAMLETPEGMKDLVELVHALTKGPSEPTSKSADANLTDDAEADDGQTADGNPAADADLLTLLAANAALNGQPADTQAQPAVGNAAIKPGNADAVEAAGDGVLDAPKASAPTTVRLEKQDTTGIDLHIDTNEDGSMKLDVSVASGNATDVVQVVESRRYIGLAPSTNAATVTAAMTGDPDWSTALSSQATGKPLITSTGEVVHTLKIQMNPVEMGHVTAAMKLVGDQLSVHLTAHTLKGYAELQKDSSAILESLKSQGFTVEQVTVSMTNSIDRQDTGAGNRQPADQGQQMGAQQGNQRGNGERSQEQSYRQQQTGISEELTRHDSTIQSTPVAGSSAPRSGQLYL